MITPKRRALWAAISGAYRRNHLARNSGYIILSTGITGLLGMGFWGICARIFPTASVGVASALIASMSFASTFAMMGLGTTVLQVLSKADDKLWSDAVNALVFAGTGLGLLAGGCLALAVPHLSSALRSANTPLVAVSLVLGTALLTLASLLDEVFQAERAAQYVVIRGATFGVLKLCLLLVPVALASHAIGWVIFSWITASGATSSISLYWQLRRLGRRHRYRLRGVGEYILPRLRLLMLHHLTTLGGIIIPSLMPLLVVARLSSVDNAHFYIAWLLSSVLLTVSGAVAGNLLADASYDPGLLKAKVWSATKIITLLLLPPAAVVALLGRPILGIFGGTYEKASYGVLLIFVIVAIPDAVTNVYVTVLRVRGKPGTAAAMNLGMAAVALLGAWYLMPSLGPAGAALGWAASQASGSLFVAAHAWRMQSWPNVALAN